jgi:hypothetical protein
MDFSEEVGQAFMEGMKSIIEKNNKEILTEAADRYCIKICKMGKCDKEYCPQRTAILNE